MESYVYGTSSGYKTKQTIGVSIKTPTTTTIKPVTSTSARVTTSTTVSTTTAPTTIKSTTTTTTPVPVIIESKDETTLANDIETRIIESHEDDTVEALPVSNIEAKEETPIGLIAGVIVSLIAMAIIFSVVGVTWYRRRKSHLAIISYLQTVRKKA